MTTGTLPISGSADRPLVEKSERFVFYNADWDFYEQMLSNVEGRRVYVTYDRGMLEIMSPLPEHEVASELFSVLIRALAEERDLPIRGFGSVTLRRRAGKGGLEPDKCFYIASVQAVLGKRELDLATDPPPDLAVEVEITSRLGARLDVYARLGVSELWRYDGQTLTVNLLQKDGTYQSAETSPSFPGVPVSDMARWIREGATGDETAWIKRFREWVRQFLTV